MHQLIYILLNEDNEIIAVYDDKDLANKLRPAIEKKLGEKIVINVFKLNLDITLINKNKL